VQPLYLAFLGTVKSIRAPAWPVIFILLLFKVLPFARWLSLLMLGRHRSQTLKHRDPFCITLPRSALRAILDSRQSAHTGVPAILEERAMPMVMCIFTLLLALPSTVLIFFTLRLILETLPVLVLILLEEMGGSRPLISNVPYLFFVIYSFSPFWGRSQGSAFSFLA
jgi:hypothetical protein